MGLCPPLTDVGKLGMCLSDDRVCDSVGVLPLALWHAVRTVREKSKQQL